MKRKMKRTICILTVLLSISFSACRVEENQASLENSSEQGEKVAFDIQTKLNEAESQAGALEKILFEDGMLTQADMNDISYEIYMVWDDALNSIWQVLEESLNKENIDELLEEQRIWITEKEEEVKLAGEEAGGGSLAGLICNQRAAELTRKRVYELAGYLGYIGTIPENDRMVEKIEDVPYQEVKTTIRFMVEGLEEEVSAIMFEGENYSITIPEEGWEMAAKGVWRSDINNKVQISIVDYTGEDIDSVCENLFGSGYEVSQYAPHVMSFEDRNGLVWNVRLFTKDEKVIGVFYDYPAEAAEGFGVRLTAIVDTFAWK